MTGKRRAPAHKVFASQFLSNLRDKRRRLTEKKTVRFDGILSRKNEDRAFYAGEMAVRVAPGRRATDVNSVFGIIRLTFIVDFRHGPTPRYVAAKAQWDAEFPCLPESRATPTKG